LHEKILAEVKRYQQLNADANKAASEYANDAWLPWRRNDVLNQVASLPVSIDGYANSASYLNSLSQSVRGQGAAAQSASQSLDFAENAISGFGKTVAVGTAFIFVAGVGLALAPVTVTLVAGTYLAISIGAAGAHRLAAGQGVGGSLLGAASDVSGFTGIYTGLYDMDPIVGKKLGLSAATRGNHLGCGVAGIALWIGGGRVLRSGTSFGKNLGLRPFEPWIPTGVTNYYLSGSGKDAAWAKLSLKDKYLSEIGQNTLPNPKYADIAGANPLLGSGPEAEVAQQVAMGQAIGPIRGLFTLFSPSALRNLGTTIPTGPTSGVRALGALATGGAAINVTYDLTEK
jgi:hypothetical protein